jgi:hypothetical protein
MTLRPYPKGDIFFFKVLIIKDKNSVVEGQARGGRWKEYLSLMSPFSRSSTPTHNTSTSNLPPPAFHQPALKP